MKTVKYTLNDKIRYLMSPDNQLNLLIKYIENTELVIESDGFNNKYLSYDYNHDVRYLNSM